MRVIKWQKLPTRRRLDSSDSSSDDNNDYLILTRARAKRRAERRSRNIAMSSNVQSANQHTDGSRTGDQSIATSSGINQSADEMGVEAVDDQNSDLDETFGSCISHNHDHDLLNDTDQSIQDVSSDNADNSQQSVSFTGIDSRGMNMSEFERHESAVVKRPATKSSTGTTTRSTTMPNIASGSTTTQDVNSRSNSSRYNLRKNPKKETYLGVASPSKRKGFFFGKK